ncbi:MAG: YihY/virulence factor BrkB family protein [Bacteroidota bacterium]|nr:YihY/virulence factor BrkB family protein [Bacteroidota bacterium]
MSKFSVKGFWHILQDVGSGFSKHHVLKLSASLAYYTIFGIGPMMLVIIFFANLFWGREAINGTIYHQLSGLVGEQTALQIQDIIKNASVSGNNFAAIFGFVLLIVAATSIFSEMQSSLNIIWNLKVKKGNTWLRMLKNRLLSFSITASLGFLLLVSLFISSLLDGLMGKLQEIFPQVGFVIIYIANLLFTLFVVALLFAIIYRVLPDAIIGWEDVTAGALFTAVLFMIGKFGISIYIGHSSMGSAYGSAGSLVILLLWIYYSSVILYLGAEFTKAYALKYGSVIKPDKYAVTIQRVEVESGENSVQENEKHSGETEEKIKKVNEDKKKKGIN